MRKAALLVLIFSELAILLLEESALNTAFVSLLSTLIVVLSFAFLLSFLLRKMKGIKTKNNYLVSGISGIVLGIFYFSWAQAHIPQVVDWIYHWGTIVLLGIILIAGLVLFQSPKKN